MKLTADHAARDAAAAERLAKVRARARGRGRAAQLGAGGRAVQWAEARDVARIYSGPHRRVLGPFACEACGVRVMCRSCARTCHRCVAAGPRGQGWSIADARTCACAEATTLLQSRSIVCAT